MAQPEGTPCNFVSLGTLIELRISPPFIILSFPFSLPFLKFVLLFTIIFKGFFSRV